MTCVVVTAHVTSVLVTALGNRLNSIRAGGEPCDSPRPVVTIPDTSGSAVGLTRHVSHYRRRPCMVSEVIQPKKLIAGERERMLYVILGLQVCPRHRISNFMMVLSHLV